MPERESNDTLTKLLLEKFEAQQGLAGSDGIKDYFAEAAADLYSEKIDTLSSKIDELTKNMSPEEVEEIMGCLYYEFCKSHIDKLDMKHTGHSMIKEGYEKVIAKYEKEHAL